MVENINRLKVVLVEKKRINKLLAERSSVYQPTFFKWCTNTIQTNLYSFGSWNKNFVKR